MKLSGHLEQFDDLVLQESSDSVIHAEIRKLFGQHFKRSRHKFVGMLFTKSGSFNFSLLLFSRF